MRASHPTDAAGPSRRTVLAGLGGAVTAVALPDLGGGARASAGATAPRTLTAAEGRLAVPGTRFGDLSIPTFAYDGEVPGPVLRYRRGDMLAVRLVNDLPEPTSLHWHGLRLPNGMDGAAPLTQPDVPPGGTFDYAFVLKNAGTFWYHTHTRGWNQQDRGLYGALIVEETNTPAVDRDILLVVDDWLIEPDGTVDERRFGDLHDWAHAGRLGTLVTVNARELPDIPVGPGERVRLRLLNVANAQIFGIAPMGGAAFVIAEDGDPVPPRPLAEETAAVLGPGQRADIVFDVPALVHGEAVTLMAWTLSGEGPIARLVAGGAGAPPKGLAGRPVDALEPNERPEPDLSSARRIDLVMEGGAMGMMGGAMHGGRMMGMRDLVSAGRMWAFNGVAGDMAEPLARLARGESVVINIRNDTRFPHAIHLHGMHFRVTKRNGAPVTEGFRDTVTMGAMDTAEVAFVAEAPGRWMLHCHMIEHQAGGMMTFLEVA